MSATTDLQTAVAAVQKGVTDVTTFINGQVQAGNVSSADAETAVASLNQAAAALEALAGNSTTTQPAA